MDVKHHARRTHGAGKPGFERRSLPDLADLFIGATSASDRSCFGGARDARSLGFFDRANARPGDGYLELLSVLAPGFITLRKV